MKKTLIFCNPEYSDLAIKLRDNYRAHDHEEVDIVSVEEYDDIEYAKFSPDSNFLLLSRLHTGGYTLLSVRPEDCKQEPYEVQQIQLPNRPSPRFEPGRRYMPAYVQFSPDGFHLMMVNKPWGHKGDDQIIPWLRLSYDYVVSDRGKDNRAKKQGIFSKLFKTK